MGSTGSTAISFILPGLFFYKISHPDSIHHQRLVKEDDDVYVESDSAEDEGVDTSASTLVSSVASIASAASGASGAGQSARTRSRWRRKWRWDLEHLDHGLLRKLSLALAIYGMCVMVVCW